MGNTYVIAEVAPARLDGALPDLATIPGARDADPGLNGRFTLCLCARTGPTKVATRMLSPLVGTFEDPATGSA